MDKLTIPVSDVGEVSDGYHTFNELYEHRVALFILVMSLMPEKSWRSEFHADSTRFEGWFVAGLDTPFGQITYHLPMNVWDDPALDGIKKLSTGPEFDGHTSSDVLDRLAKLAGSISGD